MTPLLTTIFARYRSMSWGQRGYGLIVVAAIIVFGIGAINHWRAWNYERMNKRILAAGARSTRSVTSPYLSNEEDAYFLALLGDFSCIAITGVQGHGPACAIDAELLRKLRNYPEVNRLQLVHMPLKHEDFQGIYELENLRWLSLAFDQLTDADLAGVEKLQSLDTLDLQFTQLTDASIPALAKLTGLSKIDITGTDITPAGAERLRWEYRLAQGTQSTTTVNYRPSPTPRYREAVIRLLPTKSYVIDSRNPAGGMRLMLRPEIWKGYERDIPWIAQLTDVETVIIRDMPITPEILTAIAKLPNLRQLTISDTSLTGMDFSQLAGCRKLRMLRLGGTPLDEKFVQSLAKLHSLETLFIFNCRVSSAACQSLANIQSVQSLHLRQLEVDGNEFSLLLSKLEHSPRLRLLDLAHVPIDNETISKLARLKQLASLGLSSTEIDDDAVPMLCEFTHLQQLDISDTQISAPTKGKSDRDGTSQLEAALFPFKVRVVHSKSKTALSALNLEQLTANVTQAPAAAALPAASGPMSSASKGLEIPSR